MTETADPQVIDLSAPKTVHLDLDVFGHGVVELDGVDVTKALRSVHFSTNPDPGELTTVVLQVIPRRGVEFTGAARVMLGEPPLIGPAVVEFLTAIDAGELERAALNREDLDADENAMTRAVLAQLIEWASGGGA